ncbi:MAG: hypothetical protein ACYTGZ_15620, partial [Planctomycetota bacterium]
LTLCWMTVLGPATEKATYILTTPVLAWLLIDSVRTQRRGWTRVYIAIYALYVLPAAAGVSRSLIRSTPVRVALPVATLALFGILLARAIRAIRDPREASR